jgi:hypothetical protein
MDLKGLKSDLTYCCKKYQKDNVAVDANTDNLEVTEDGKFVAVSTSLHPLEMLILIKGWAPTPELVEGRYYNLNVSSFVAQQAQLATGDLYSFMEGLENVEHSNPKDPFYMLGIYIREKFAPINARQEMLRKHEYVISKGESVLVRKWIVHTRPMPGCKRGGPPTIVEVECELLTSQEDPSIKFLKNGEFKGRVLKPEFLHEETRVLKDGVLKDVVLPSIYMSHALYDSEQEAVVHAQLMVRHELEFEVRKKKRDSFTEQDVQDQANLIQIVRLPS